MIVRARWLLPFAVFAAAGSAAPPSNETADPFVSEVLLDDLDHPWSLAFIAADDLLITERSGALLRVRNQRRSRVSGTPDVVARGQGGLLDVALHPRFGDGENWIYLSFADGRRGNSGTAVGRGRLADNRITDWQLLFSLPHKTSSRRHFGGRLAFDADGHLYLTVGDRGERERAQTLADPAGSVLRLTDTGAIPDDNPHPEGGHPALYSWGHRNPQGLTVHPVTGALWAQEHGPQGGDELNLIRAGHNYGWPVITHGTEYVTGIRIGEGTHKPGMEQPAHYWVPSIAPSGMAFYQGTPFADWNGDVLIGALKYRLLVRLELDGTTVVAEHRYLKDRFGRIRDVRIGPDGLIYLLTDASNGRLIRLKPAPPERQNR